MGIDDNQEPKRRKRTPRSAPRPTLAEIKLYCIQKTICGEDALRESNRDYWFELVGNSWSRENFWDAVKIMLGKKQLPPNYNPAMCQLYLSIDDLLSLGIELPKTTAK